MRLEQVPVEQLQELVEDLADLRHDLGKYIGFDTRFAGDDVEALRAALRSDLLATRRRGRRVLSAWEVWGQLRPPELAGDVDVRLLDERLERLREVDLDGDLHELQRARALSAEVTEATRRLYRRARGRLDQP